MDDSKKKFSLESYTDTKYKYICKECSKQTTHSIISEFKEEGIQDCGNGNTYDWNIKNQIIQCLGCDTVSFRTASTNSEDYDHDENGSPYYFETIKYYPGRTLGLGLIDIHILPPNVQEIYNETLFAIEHDQNILAGIGVRALIETICKDLLADGKDLYHKINSLHEKSIITKEGVETLHKLRVLGNDAAHEVKKHNRQQLSLAVEIIEHMLDGTYIIPYKVSRDFK